MSFLKIGQKSSSTYSEKQFFTISRLIFDAAKYLWSKFSNCHYSDLHTCILSLASVSNINLAAMVKENPMRFQQQTHLSLLLEIINNTWFPPVIKIIISILSSICYKLKMDYILDITSRRSMVGKQCSTKRQQHQVNVFNTTNKQVHHQYQVNVCNTTNTNKLAASISITDGDGRGLSGPFQILKIFLAIKSVDIRHISIGQRQQLLILVELEEKLLWQTCWARLYYRWHQYREKVQDRYYLKGLFSEKMGLDG